MTFPAGRSRSTARAAGRFPRTRAAGRCLRSARGLALTALVWVQPPAVLPVPSRSGAEGPPRPFGAVPPFGRPPGSTLAALVAAQDRAMLDGPFPAHGLARGVSDGAFLLDPSAEVRGLALARIRQAGASVVRIPVNWSELVAPHPGGGFDPRDPASRSYAFGRLDAAVRSAVSAGLRPLLVVSRAPAFAEAPGGWPYAYAGSWAPSPLALEDFAAALARRYDGSFPDPSLAGAALPRVTLFQAWNEPNLARYLEPQWIARDGRWQPFSPLLYRQLLNGFYAGVKAVQPAALVVSAGLAPNGEPAGVGRMAPVAFLRSLLCLDGSGRRASAGCGEPAHLDALAFHPLSVASPDASARSALDVSIADAAKLTRLLALARRLGTVLPAGPKPVWVTELNWESAPQAPGGVPARLQARWVSRALHRLWVAGVDLVSWEFLVDPYPALTAAVPAGRTIRYARPAGLYAAGVDGDPRSARPKPFLRGFAFPFDPLRIDTRRVRVWALAPGPAAPVALQRLRRGRWRTIAWLRSDSAAVLNAVVALRGAATLRARSGETTSALAYVPTTGSPAPGRR